MLALTFDDGPDPRGTPAVLDALDAAGVRATFFVLGEQADAHPGLLGQLIEGGHDVQVHGYRHLRHPDCARLEVERDLDAALAALRRAGIESTSWRVPWGQLAPFTPAVAAARGLRVVGWTADTHDWRGDDAATMLRSLELTRGVIVLAHDGIGPGARRETADATAQLIGPLVAWARARGLLPGPLAPNWPVPIPVGNPNFDLGVGRSA